MVAFIIAYKAIGNEDPKNINYEDYKRSEESNGLVVILNHNYSVKTLEYKDKFDGSIRNKEIVLTMLRGIDLSFFKKRQKSYFFLYDQGEITFLQVYSTDNRDSVVGQVKFDIIRRNVEAHRKDSGNSETY